MPEISISENGLLKLLKNLKKTLLLRELEEEIAPSLRSFTNDRSRPASSQQTGQRPVSCIRKALNIWHQTTDRPPLTCILCKVLNTHKHQILLIILMSRASCMTSNIGLGRDGHVRSLLILTEDLVRNASAGKQTDIILKAFDKVSNSKLIWKRYQYGIRGHVLSWIRAFLGSRS